MIVFLAAVATVAVYFAQRPTVARGAVLAEQLVEANHELVKAMTCDPEVPIGADGAHFTCTVEYRTGLRERTELTMDREGAIHVVKAAHPKAPPSADPWAD